MFGCLSYMSCVWVLTLNTDSQTHNRTNIRPGRQTGMRRTGNIDSNRRTRTKRHHDHKHNTHTYNIGAGANRTNRRTYYRLPGGVGVTNGIWGGVEAYDVHTNHRACKTRRHIGKDTTSVRQVSGSVGKCRQVSVFTFFEVTVFVGKCRQVSGSGRRCPASVSKWRPCRQRARKRQ